MRATMRNTLRTILLTAAATALTGATAGAQTRTVGNLSIETFASGLRNPWGLAFLPDGQLLVTERSGQIRLVSRDAKLSPPLQGVPRVFAVSQGGLLDIAVDAKFAENRTIYFCFAEPAEGGGRTSLARAEFSAEAMRLDDVKVVFRQTGPLSRGNHWGCRITQTRDGNLFLTLGDHFTARDEAQNLDNHIGKIVRLRPTGRRHRTIRSSAAPAPNRKSGATATATCKARRSMRPAATGRTNTARAAAMRSTRRKPARTTAGR